MKRLEDLEVGEISLVPEGANKRKMLVFKSAGGKMPQPNEMLQKLLKAADPAIMNKVDAVISRHLMPQGEDTAGSLRRPTPDQNALINKDDLTTEGRKHVAEHNFAIPPDKYPIHDESHARNALARVAQHGTPEEKSKVQAAVHAKYPNIGKTEKASLSPEESEQAKHALKAIVRIVSPWKDKLSPQALHEVLDAAGFQVNTSSTDQDGAIVSKDQGAVNVGEGKPADTDGTPTDGANASERDPGHEVTKMGEGHAGAAIPEKDLSEEKDVLEKMGVKKEHHDEAKSEAEKAYKAHMAKLGYEKYPEAHMAMKAKEESPVSKTAVHKSADGGLDLSGVPAGVKPVVEAIFKANQSLVQKNADLEKRLNERESAEQKREIVAKAAGYSHLGIPQADLVSALEDAAKQGRESYERITKSFDTLNEQARTSKVFAEYGTSAPGASKGSAEAKIDAAVDAIVQKSSGVSRETAYEQFIKSPEGQRLYADYKSGRKDGI